METYTRILDANPRARVVVIQGDGEPLLDPTVFDKLALAREPRPQDPDHQQRLAAEAKMIERLLAEGPDLFLVSLDAVSPETNQKNRTGLDYARVTVSLAELCARRERAPRIIGLLSVVHGAFTDETAAALRDFDRIGIDVLFYKQLNRAFEAAHRRLSGR